MSTSDYQKAFDAIIQHIKNLTLEDQIKVIDEVKASIQNKIEGKRLHDISEFAGVAKDFWKDVDVEEYIRQERDSWDIEPSQYYSDTHSKSDKL